MADDPIKMRSLLKTADGERWLDALGVLLDLEPQIADNWDAVPDPVRPAVTQVWLEHRPPLMPAPTPLAHEFSRRIMHDAAPPSQAKPCDAAAALSDSDPRRRLRAVANWVVPNNLGALLAAAANDDHPLVRGVASYALIHAGSASPNEAASAPAPPLLIYNPPSAIVDAQGAGWIRIGPLQPLAVPLPSANQVRMVVKYLDVDLLAAPIEIEPQAVTPGLHAARLFTASGRVDWLELVIRCHYIATASAAVAAGAQARSELDMIAASAQRRAQQYAAFGEALADALGLQWKPHGVDVTKQDRECAIDVLRRLRLCYNRTYQDQWLDIPRTSQDEDAPPRVEVKQSLELLAGRAVGVHVDGLAIDEVANRLTTVVFSQMIGHITADGRAAGLDIERADGQVEAVPPGALFRGKIVIRDADGGQVDCMRVGLLAGENVPWQCGVSVVVQQCAGSVLRGVVIDEVEQGPV